MLISKLISQLAKLTAWIYEMLGDTSSHCIILLWKIKVENNPLVYN